MKEFNFNFLCGHFSKNLIWIRLGVNSRGFKLARTSMLFSERYGYKKYFQLPFKWRLSYIKPFNLKKR